MSVTAVNQKEYLKKYLSSGPDDKKKKKKRKKAVRPTRVQIVDDDIDLKNMLPVDGNDYNLYELAEDAPLIVGYVDERPDEVKALELYRGSKWKIIQDENGIEDIKVTEEKVVSSDPADRFREIEVMPPVAGKPSQSESLHTKHKKSNAGVRRGKINTDDDSDVSPLRRSRTGVDSDESPPGIPKGNRRSSADNISKRNESGVSRKDGSSPSKKYKRDSDRNRSDGDDSDESPPRRSTATKNFNEHYCGKSRAETDSDTSPPRRGRNKDDFDESPRRKKSIKYSSNEPSRRKSRFDRDSDESPPRNRRSTEETDKSPINKTKPPRKKSRFDVDSDESPPRKRTQSRDAFVEYYQKSKVKQQGSSGALHKDQKDAYKKPEKLIKRERDDSDESPPRQRGNVTREMPEKSRSERYLKERIPSSESKHDAKIDKASNSKRFEKQERTLEGKKAGLQDSTSLRMENLEHELREKEMFAKMSDEVSGRGAVPVVRDRVTGKKRDLAREAAEKAAEKEKEDEKKEKYYRWGKGLKQVEDHQSRLHEDLYEMSKPLARYADDKDLEKHLKDQDREGDPMQEYIRSQKLKQDKENPSQSGDVKKHLVYQGPPPPPNRFGIKPGYRWDGVDRSTGFEQKWFQEQNSRKALLEEAYKWSTEDM